MIRKYSDMNKDITKTSEFQRWFGNSKVVDSNGNPLIVYHGTNSHFTVFQESRSGQAGKGFYFTPYDGESMQYGGKIMKVYLSLQNPVILKRQEIPMSVKSWRENMEYLGYDGVMILDGVGSLDELVAWYPTQIKSINNVGTFDPNNPDITQ